MKYQVIFVCALAIVWAGFVLTMEIPLERQSLPVFSEGRIINGTSAEEGQFPYMVLLKLSIPIKGNISYGYCTGTIISDRWIMTAAHCIDDDVVSVDIHMGSTNWKTPQQIITVSSDKFIQHEDYLPVIALNDIGLIETPQLNFSSNINKTLLPTLGSNYNYAGEQATAVGWGKTYGNAINVTDQLQYVTLPVITHGECRSYFFLLYFNTKVICTGNVHNKSTCNGDSGGPLIYDGKQIGITSFGVKGCEGGYPSGYTRVTEFLQWIKDKTGISY